MSESLEKFGAFIVRNLRDKMLGNLEMLSRGDWKAPELRELQNDFSSFSDVEKHVVRKVVEQLIVTGMHDLLFAIQEDADAGGPIKVLVDGHEVAKLSDGLHGEIFGDAGWIVRYSEYPAESEIERSKWAAAEIERMCGQKESEDGSP